MSGSYAVEAENPDGNPDRPEPRSGSESASIQDGEKGDEVAGETLPKARSALKDQDGQLVSNGGYSARDQLTKGDPNSESVKGDASTSAPIPFRSNSGLPYEADPSAAGSAPSVLSDPDTLAGLQNSDEIAMSVADRVKRKNLELASRVSGETFPSIPQFVENKTIATEHHVATGQATPNGLRTAAVPTASGQRHHPMSGEWYSRKHLGLTMGQEPIEILSLPARTTGDIAIGHQHAAAPSPTLLVQGTDQNVRLNLNAQLSMQGQQHHQPFFNNFQISESPVSEASFRIGPPIIDGSGIHTGSSTTTSQVLNLFSGASVVGMNGLNPGQSAISQIVGAIGNSANGAIVLALNPQELGQVRMALVSSETGLVVSILAERAETLDIMRRHSEALTDEFRRFGFENLGLEFSDGGSNFNLNSGEGAFLANAETEQELLAQDLQASPGWLRETTGLDMRI